ncbi:MAG: methyltransferase, partial [Ferruginibacter sp.]|nr:methyltransferase [Ferruginibacter sp.]
MSNPFQFKQFTVHQDKCAMKVCTDSCLFGAWINSLIQKHPYKSALDIGTGTGLLSLMASQGNHLKIDAIEIEENATLQAKENVSASVWRNLIHVYHTPIQEFIPLKTYDVIFSNPPFFENDLMSTNAEKNAAKHHTGLTLEVLAHFISGHLSSQGIAMVLLPFHRLVYFEKILLAKKLFIEEIIL